MWVRAGKHIHVMVVIQRDFCNKTSLSQCCRDMESQIITVAIASMDHIPTAVYRLTVDMVTLYCNSTKRQNKQPGSHKVVILLDLFNASVFLDPCL
jgi:hypothetical protein